MYDDEKYQGITVHKTGGVKYYVSEDLYLNRDKKFFKNLANAEYVKRDTDTEFPNHCPIDMQRNFHERYVYEVLNHNTTAGIQPKKEDFVLPVRKTRPSTNRYSHFHFENKKYYWKDSTCSDKFKKLIFTKERRIVLYRYNIVKTKPGDFIFPPEKKILELMTPIYFKGIKDIKNNDPMQSSFFYTMVLANKKNFCH